MAESELLAAALDRVADPSSGAGLIASGRAAPPRQAGGTVDVVIDVSGLDPAQREGLEQQAQAALGAVPGVDTVRVLLTAERAAGPKLIAVASGKGGVGKSTVAANLAIALAQSGVRSGWSTPTFTVPRSRACSTRRSGPRRMTASSCPSRRVSACPSCRSAS